VQTAERRLPVICQKMASRPIAQYLPQLLVFVAYNRLCMLCPTKQATPQVVIGYLWLRIVLLLLD